MNNELMEAIDLIYGKKNNQAGPRREIEYTKGYKKAISLLHNLSDKGSADAMYFLSRCYFGPNFIPFYSLAKKYENDNYGKNFLKKSFELESCFAVINGSLRVSNGISQKKINQKLKNNSNVYSDSYQKLLVLSDNDIFYADYILANFYYWGDNRKSNLLNIKLPYFSEEERIALSYSYFNKAIKNGMSWSLIAVNYMDCVITLEDENGLVEGIKNFQEFGFTQLEMKNWCNDVVGGPYIQASPWFEAMCHVYNIKGEHNVKKAWKICKKNQLTNILDKFNVSLLGLSILYENNFDIWKSVD